VGVLFCPFQHTTKKHLTLQIHSSRFI
jgi:hypothetical protein